VISKDSLHRKVLLLKQTFQQRVPTGFVFRIAQATSTQYLGFVVIPNRKPRSPGESEILGRQTT
jgi:hypothetical protein